MDNNKKSKLKEVVLREKERNEAEKGQAQNEKSYNVIVAIGFFHFFIPQHLCLNLSKLISSLSSS